jgi:hypothetical protein
MLVTAASGGSLLYDQCVPFAIPNPKNRKTDLIDLPPGATCISASSPHSLTCEIRAVHFNYAGCVSVNCEFTSLLTHVYRFSSLTRHSFISVSFSKENI